MLIDIKFHSWDRVRRDTASDINPSVDEEFRRSYWEKNLSPESLKKRRIQEGVYNMGSIWTRLSFYSDFQTLNRYRPMPSDFKEALKDYQRVVERGEPGEWYGRGDSVEQILAYLEPTWAKENRYFVISVLQFANADNIEKPHKMGGYINDPDDVYERMQKGFWTFQRIEVKPPLSIDVR